MDDLGKAMSSGGSLMLGGGNPASIPEMEATWRKRMEEILEDGRSFENVLGNYDPPQGRPKFLKAVAEYFRSKYGWKISEKNVVVTPGSQAAYFSILNMLAGPSAGGTSKKILLPITPEYIGYADQGVSENIFYAQKPLIETAEDRKSDRNVRVGVLLIAPLAMAVVLALIHFLWMPLDVLWYVGLYKLGMY